MWISPENIHVNFTWKITGISHENFHINFSFTACFSWKFSHESHKILLNPPLICSWSLIIQTIKTVWSWNFKFRILRKTAVPNTPFYPWVVGKLKAWYSIHFCGLYENKIKSSLSKKIFWQLFFIKSLPYPGTASETGEVPCMVVECHTAWLSGAGGHTPQPVHRTPGTSPSHCWHGSHTLTPSQPKPLHMPSTQPAQNR